MNDLLALESDPFTTGVKCAWAFSLLPYPYIVSVLDTYVNEIFLTNIIYAYVKLHAT